MASFMVLAFEVTRQGEFDMVWDYQVQAESVADILRDGPKHKFCIGRYCITKIWDANSSEANPLWSGREFYPKLGRV